MDNFSFQALLFFNWDIYLLSLIISMGIYSLIAKKFVKALIDPLLINLFFISFGTAVVVFLLFQSKISYPNFMNFLLAQVSFWTGFGLLYKKNIQFNKQVIFKDQEDIIIKLLFLFSLLINIISTLSAYYYAGIPIFAESRLDTYSGGTGFGILSRLVAFTNIVNIFCLFYYWKRTRKYSLDRLGLVLYFIFSLVTSILAGSKSAFLVYIFVFFCYVVSSSDSIYAVKKFLKITSYFLLSAGLGVVIIVILIQSRSESDTETILFKLTNRMVSTGDVYWMSYPNNMYKIIDNAHPVKYLFQDVLGSFRLVPWTDFPKQPGIILNWYHQPFMEGINKGPNARFDVLGYAYWGWGNLIFSFILGLIVSGLMYRLPKILPDSILSRILWTYCYINALVLITDPILGISFFNNLTFNIILLVIPVLFLSLTLWSIKQKTIVRSS